jgi:hypothetical protein
LRLGYSLAGLPPITILISKISPYFEEKIFEVFWGFPFFLIFLPINCYQKWNTIIFHGFLRAKLIFRCNCLIWNIFWVGPLSQRSMHINLFYSPK